MRLVDGHGRVLHAGDAALASDLDLGLPHPGGGIDRGAGARVHAGRRLPYVESAVERGLDVDEFAPRLSFFFNAHLDFFEEIAKYRPLGASGRASSATASARGTRAPWLMRFHSQTAGVSLTAQQPEVNIVRTAIEALAAVLGGTQSLHTNSFDEALALPTEDAVRIALRTQQVIAHETGVVNTIDPLGGSYYVEELTNRLEAQAYDYFDRIEKLGGSSRRSRRTSSQREIADAAFTLPGRGRARRAGDRRREPLPARGRAPLEILKIDAALEQQQIERRAGGARQARLGRRRGASGGAQARPPRATTSTSCRLILDAARDYVTMGEICDACARSGACGGRQPVF